MCNQYSRVIKHHASVLSPIRLENVPYKGEAQWIVSNMCNEAQEVIHTVAATLKTEF